MAPSGERQYTRLLRLWKSNKTNYWLIFDVKVGYVKIVQIGPGVMWAVKHNGPILGHLVYQQRCIVCRLSTSRRLYNIKHSYCIVLIYWCSGIVIPMPLSNSFYSSVMFKFRGNRHGETSDYILREWYTTQNVLWSHASVCLCVCLSVCLSVRGPTPTLLHRPGCNLEAW